MRTIIRFNDWPLAVKLLVVMILIASIPITIVGFWNAQNTSTSLEHQIGGTFEREARDIGSFIVTILGQEVALLESLSLNGRIKGRLAERNAGYIGSEEEILAELQELDETWRNAGEAGNFLTRRVLSLDASVNPVTPILHDFIRAHGENVEVFITDIRGGTVGATNLLSDYYQADEAWWQAAYNDGQGATFISDPEFDESANTWAVLIAVPIFSQGDQGEFLGIARTTLTFEAITDRIESIQIGQTGRVQLLNKDGQILFDPDPESVPLSETLFRTILSQPTISFIYGDEAIFGAAKLAFFGEETGFDPLALRPNEVRLRWALDDLGWRVVVRQDTAEAFAPVFTANRLAIMTGLVGVVAAGLIAFGLSWLLTRQVEKIQILFDEIGVGNFRARAEVISGDELGVMARNLNTMLDNTVALIQTQEERDRIQAAIQKLLDDIADVAEGDLTSEAEVSSEITGSIADSFNAMINQLRQIISRVQAATIQVSTSANEISGTAELLSQGSESQAAKITDTSAAVEEMSVSIQQVSENAARSAEVAGQALTNAQQGVEVVQQTITSMNRIREQVDETSKRITRLGESSQEIGDIIQLIDDIAYRTGILALNASIQAAMAGEAGKTFAVVAEEVEQLATSAKQATRQVEGIIRTIQSETNETVAAMETSRLEIETGTNLANQAGQALSQIEDVSNQLAELIQSIAMASQQQARGSEAVARSMSDIAGVTQETAQGTKLAAVSINDLAVLADDLRSSVSAFKLPSSSNGHNGEMQS